MSIRTVLVLSFTVLSAVRRGEVTPQEACMTSQGDPVRVTCPGDGDRIQVNRVVYSEYANLSANTGRDICEKEFPCEADARVAFKPQLWKPILDCYGKRNCSLTFGDAGKYGCGGGFLNHVRMNYSCVQADNLVDLCGNIVRNITTTTQLMYSPESGEVSRDCKCAVTGGHHVVKLIFVVLPIATVNCTMNFTVTWDEMIRVWKEMEYNIDEDIPGNPQSSTIHMVADCTRSVNTILWLQITPVTCRNGLVVVSLPGDPKTADTASWYNAPTADPKISDPGESLWLHCEQSATTTSHEEASEKPTTEHIQTTQSSDNLTTIEAARGKVIQNASITGVVAGTALGGVALVVCLAVLLVFLCKKRRRNGGGDHFDSVSRRCTVTTCDGVDGVFVVDNVEFAGNGENDYGGYQTVSGPDGQHKLETVSPPDATAAGHQFDSVSRRDTVTKYDGIVDGELVVDNNKFVRNEEDDCGYQTVSGPDGQHTQETVSPPDATAAGDQFNSVSRRDTVTKYDDVVDGALVVDNNEFAGNEEDDYGGYQTVSGSHAQHTLETVSPPDATAAGHQFDSVSRRDTVTKYDDVVGGALVVDNNEFFENEEDDYGGYQTVSGSDARHTHHTLETLSSSDTASAGNPDHPQTSVAGVGTPQTSTAVYDHIGSVPNANKKISDSDEDHDDHYNTLNLDRQPAGDSQRVDDAQTRVDQGERTSDGSDKRTSDPVYAQVNK